MQVSLTSQEIEYLRKTIKKPLSQYSAKLYFFGSRTEKKHHPFSDVDILIQAPVEQYEPIRSLLTSVRENLEEGLFPYKVDLVLEPDLAESYKDNIKQQLVLFD